MWRKLADANFQRVKIHGANLSISIVRKCNDLLVRGIAIARQFAYRDLPIANDPAMISRKYREISPENRHVDKGRNGTGMFAFVGTNPQIERIRV